MIFLSFWHYIQITTQIVEFVDIPADAKVGERLFVEGLSGEPLLPNACKKKKAWENTAVKLRSNGDKVACYDGKPIMSSAGPCTAPTLADAILS